MKRGITKAYEVLIGGLAAFAGVLIILSMVAVCLEVILRQFFNKPQGWVDELTEYALLYMTFTAAAWLLKERSHVQVDIVLSILKSRTRSYCAVISAAFGILVCLVLTYFGIIITWDYYMRGVYNPTLLEIPKWPLLGIIPVGMFLLTIEFIRKFWADLNKLRGEGC